MYRSSSNAVLLTVVLMVLFLASTAETVRATDFEVNSNRDDSQASDANLGDGNCLDSLGACTLRAAIEQANANGQADTITFSTAMNINVSGTMGAFPPLSDSVNIDASSVWDSVNNRPGVKLNGGGGAFDGLTINASWCEVYGLYITNFGDDGIYIQTSNNKIGGTQAGQRNVISGNGNTGVIILSSTATNNTVQGNFIGLDPTGTAKQPNLGDGVYVGGAAETNTIGGSTVFGWLNYISGNGRHGIYVADAESLGNKIGGNAIGVPVSGSQNVGNSYDGIYVNRAGQTEIGGGGLAGNLIFKNGRHGIFLYEASYTTIQDTYILLNVQDGVRIHYGFNNDILLNVIGSNGLNGVLVVGATAIGNQISSNSIFENGLKGIELLSGGNAELPAPVITSAGSIQVWGVASGGARVVQVYSDSLDEGETYHGMCVVSLPSGAWTYTGSITGPNVTALASDLNGSTSEFSVPYLKDFELLMILPSILEAAKGRKKQ